MMIKRLASVRLTFELKKYYQWSDISPLFKICSVLFFILTLAHSEEWSSVPLFSDEKVKKGIEFTPNSTIEIVDDPEDSTKRSLCFRNKESATDHSCLSIPFYEIGVDKTGTLSFKIMVDSDHTEVSIRIGMLTKKLYPLEPLMNINFFMNSNGDNLFLFNTLGKKIGNLKEKVWNRVWIVSKSQEGTKGHAYIAFSNKFFDGYNEKPETISTLNLLHQEPAIPLNTLGLVIGLNLNLNTSTRVYLSDLYFSESENLSVPHE